MGTVVVEGWGSPVVTITCRHCTFLQITGMLVLHVFMSITLTFLQYKTFHFTCIWPDVPVKWWRDWRCCDTLALPSKSPLQPTNKLGHFETFCSRLGGFNNTPVCSRSSLWQQNKVFQGKTRSFPNTNQG